MDEELLEMLMQVESGEVVLKEPIQGIVDEEGIASRRGKDLLKELYAGAEHIEVVEEPIQGIVDEEGIASRRAKGLLKQLNAEAKHIRLFDEQEQEEPLIRRPRS